MDWQTEKTIYKTRDEFGDIVVKDQGLLRTLYFGDNKKQTSVLLPNLSTLILFYAQAMMASLLFCPQPKKVLLVGLGGGSFVHFLSRAFPSLEIEVVEIRKHIIDVAYNYFGLPLKKKNLKIYHMDAKELVALKARQSEQYDIVFVDAFDQWGPAEILANNQFLNHCKQLVGTKGLCCFNLWNRREDAYSKSFRQFRHVFEGNLLELSLGKINSNVILMGFGKKVDVKQLKHSDVLATKLKEQHGIDFQRYLKLLQKQNSSLLKRLRNTIL